MKNTIIKIIRYIILFIGSFLAAVAVLTMPLFFIAACMDWLVFRRYLFYEYCNYPAFTVMHYTHEALDWVNRKLR